MKKGQFLIVAVLSVILIGGLTACSNSSEDTASINNQSSETDKTVESTDDSSQSEGTSSNDNVKSDSGGKKSDASVNEKPDNTDKKTSAKVTTQEDHTESTVTKLEGRRVAFLEKLDNIQKELDALPEKKDSDKGVTNAMKNYYGISYEKYDEALNEIYALLREKLSPEVMNELQTEQIKWIEQKEAAANENRKKYEGGTYANVAYYISTYEATKERSYELVNEYMTD